MTTETEIKVPDIGDFENVEIIEVLVKPGDSIAAEDSLITVESEKASMEIPSPSAGIVKSMAVKVGDKVSEGSVILAMEIDPETAGTPSEKDKQEQARTEPAAVSFDGQADKQAEVVVLGSGPGGYTAAFRAADLGKQVILIERYDVIGGVCLNVGCIPSKALLHTAEVINEAAEFSELGISFDKPKIDLDKLRGHKEKVVGKLTGGLKQLAKQRKVEIVQGYGRFTSANSIEVEADDGARQTIAFEHCIIAAGSQVTKLPFIPWDDPRVMDSTDALELEEIPKKLLVVGGGIIGLEMATVYHALGAKVTVVELLPGLMPGVDRDLIRLFERRIKARYENIYTDTKVTEIKPLKKGLKCKFEGKKAPEEETFDRVLVSIGRSPNGKLIDGFDGFAGELGHIDMTLGDGRLTGLGVRGGLEAYVSATGLKRTILYMLSQYMDESRFRGIAYNDLHGEEITQAAEEGDEIALKAFDFTADILGQALANFTAFTQPEAFILMGGLVNSGKWIMEPLKKYFDAYLLDVYKGKVKILLSGLPGKTTAISGAAALIWEDHTDLTD